MTSDGGAFCRCGHIRADHQPTTDRCERVFCQCQWYRSINDDAEAALGAILAYRDEDWDVSFLVVRSTRARMWALVLSAGSVPRGRAPDWAVGCLIEVGLGSPMLCDSERLS